MSDFLDTIINYYENNLSAEAKTIYRKIEKKHPELYDHCQFVIDIATKENISIEKNIKLLKRYVGLISGCIWFTDPVSNEILLPKNDWLPACINEYVWMPLIASFPVLKPYQLTGSLTNIVGFYLQDMTQYLLMEKFFRENNADIRQCRCIKNKTSFWLIFNDNKKLKNINKKIYNQNDLCYTCLSNADLIPIFDTIIWENDEFITIEGVKINGKLPSPTEIPEFLLSYFYNLK